MISPSSTELVLFLSILSFFCWGVWIATFRRNLPNWRFELYSFDFAIGVVLAGVVVALTLGSMGDDLSFTDNLMIARRRYLAFALGAGAVFNLANMLLLAAVSLTGVAIAFPICFSIALTISMAVLSLQGNLSIGMVGGGTVLALVSVVTAILAYRQVVAAANAAMEEVASVEVTPVKKKKIQKKRALKGIIVSVVSGVLMGAFFPLLGMSRSASSDFALGPYAIAFLAGIGIFLTTIIYNLYFINLPVFGEAVEFNAMLKAKFSTHLTGVIGGILWCVGLIANLVAYAAPVATPATQMVTTILGFGGAVLAAVLGFVVWKEFHSVDSKLFPGVSIASLSGALVLFWLSAS